MIRRGFAGVDLLLLRGARAAASRNGPARQAAALRCLGNDQQAACWTAPTRRHWSSQEAEHKSHLGADETSAATGASLSDVGASAGADNGSSSSSAEEETDQSAATAARAPSTAAVTEQEEERGPVKEDKKKREEAEGEEEEERLFVVRTPDSFSPLKVTVPKTTAEAMAMNMAIKKKATAKREANARALAATPSSSGGGGGGGRLPTAGARRQQGARRGGPARAGAEGSYAGRGGGGGAEEAPRTPKVMVVKPNARSRSIQVEVPLTTAECIKLNKAVKERYPGDATKQDDGGGGTRDGINGINAGYSKRWRNPPTTGGGGGGGGGSPRNVYRRGAMGSGPPALPGSTQLEHNDGQINYERTIGNLFRRNAGEQIVGIWEDIEEKEKGGEVVKLAPATYEQIMASFIEHVDLAVVAKCGRVFDHAVASGQGLRPAMYNFYMKGCSLAKLGTRAVALIEGLDRLPGKRYKPNPEFFFNLLSATCAEGMVAESKLYYGVMRDIGFDPNHQTFQSMMDMYIRENMLSDAVRVIEDIQQAGMKPRDALMNRLTYACMRQGEPELMHKALDHLLVTGSIVNAMTVKNVLYMATRRRDDEMATKIWVAAQRWGHKFSQVDYSYMVQTFFAIGKDDMALATFVQAYKEGIEVNRKTLTFCAQRLAVSNKRLDQAYYTLTSLKDNGEPIPVEAINAIIVGCAIRQAVDRCFATAEALPVVFELSPNLDTYNALMHVLGSMRAQDTDNAALGIGMSLLDEIEQKGEKPNQETFMSLVDLACMSDGLTEDFADDLVDRMTGKHGLCLDQDIVDTLASAFEDRGMGSLAQHWADKLPSLDARSSPNTPTYDSNSSSAAAGPASYGSPQGTSGGGFVRPRRVAQARGRYTGFDDGPFKASQNLSRFGDGNGRPGRGRSGRFSFGAGGRGEGRGGGGAFAAGRGGGNGGQGREEYSGDGRGFSRQDEAGDGRGAPEGGSPSTGGGWADSYKSGEEK